MYNRMYRILKFMLLGGMCLHILAASLAYGAGDGTILSDSPVVVQKGVQETHTAQTSAFNPFADTVESRTSEENDRKRNVVLPEASKQSSVVAEQSADATASTKNGMDSMGLAGEMRSSEELALEETDRQKRIAEIALPNVSANGAILIDAKSGKVLFEKNSQQRFYPASITKILTALLVIENSSLDDTVRYSRSATTNLESGAVTLGVREGDQISVRDSLYGLLLKSANEVANGLAEHIAGSVPAFAQMMNQRAAALGCTNSNFANPSGLNHENHYTTAADMAKIAAAAFENPIFREIDGTTHFNFPAIQAKSTKTFIVMGHKMINREGGNYYEGIIGGKTGYTSKAGNTLVTCAERNGRRLIVVILSSRKTHYTDTRALLDYGFAVTAIENEVGK